MDGVRAVRGVIGNDNMDGVCATDAVRGVMGTEPN